ncbi:MAG: methyl-accepting chemotaxis protein [Planctomycetota bacterium]|jgi:enamine deaminase RidA (YjgF/YER057c/UK114 family)|nr:methyl-accepting chemotaxis protein [Planctomycetota bacterium]
MNSYGNSKLKKLFLTFLTEFLVSVAIAYLVDSLLSGEDDIRPMALSALLFAMAVFVTLTLLLAGSWLTGNDTVSFATLSDFVSLPILVVDANNCYEFMNLAAEKLFHGKREENTDKRIDPRIEPLLSENTRETDLLLAQATLELDNFSFHVTIHPVSDQNGATPRRRIVILHDVSSLGRLKTVLREIDESVSILNENASKISTSSVTLSQGVTEQATSLSVITNGMSEISAKIQGNADSAVKGTQLAAQAREAAERSGNEITNVLSAMTDVQDAGIRIARIVKLIDDIAFQTNLLALNAAVEAARAGRQGKGFAVVADEVRNLAGRSAKAAKDTASMVEDVTERIGNASSYIAKLKEILGNIVQDAIRMADSSASSSATSAEQASGILAINRELGQMNTATNSIISVAEQSAASVVMLTSQIETLRNRFNAISKTFLNNGDVGEKRFASTAGNPPAINLFDEPRSSYGNWENPMYHDTSYRNINQPPSGEWHTAASSQAASGTRTAYRSSDQTGKSLMSDPAFAVGEATPQTGDRMVRPNQQIALDDSEFGRY